LDDSHLRSWRMSSLFLVSALIGVMTGFAAWGFRLLIGLIHNFAFLGQLSANYDANQHTPESPLGWMIIFVPVLGGIVVIWLIKNFAPEAKGHGVPEVMSAIHHKRGRIRGIVSIVKALASAITIGTGGSLGREGPIIQISSAFSSMIAQWLRMSVNQRNLLIACGASGGIAATFNAPLGGILFSIELLLLSVNSHTLLPVITSSVIAANVGRYLIGPEPAFHIPVATTIHDPSSPLLLLLYFPFAAAIGLVALVFIKSIYASEDFFDNLPLNPYVRHMLGMLLLGCLFYTSFKLTGHYYVQGVGYATIEDIVSSTLTSPWLILTLVLAKLLAVLLTIGSGGSGGVFSPSLYIGATIGGLFGSTLTLWLPGLGADQETFALVGMAAMVAATTSAPLTAAIMTFEMTLDYSVMLPIMVGVGVAYAVRRHFSKGDIYTLKLMRRGLSLPEGFLTDINSQIIVDDVMDNKIDFVGHNDMITGTEQVRCVVNDEGVVIGLVNPASYRIGKEFKASQATVTDFIVIQSGISIREVLAIFDKHGRANAIVSKTGNLDSKDVIGVFNSIQLTRVIANSSKMYV